MEVEEDSKADRFKTRHSEVSHHPMTCRRRLETTDGGTAKLLAVSRTCGSQVRNVFCPLLLYDASSAAILT